MNLQMYIEDLKSSVDSLDKRCKVYEKQIADFKSYLNALDVHADDSVMYWQRSCENAPDDSERAFKLIVSKEVAKNTKTLVKNLFRFIEEASKVD